MYMNVAHDEFGFYIIIFKEKISGTK